MKATLLHGRRAVRAAAGLAMQGGGEEVRRSRRLRVRSHRIDEARGIDGLLLRRLRAEQLGVEGARAEQIAVGHAGVREQWRIKGATQAGRVAQISKVAEQVAALVERRASGEILGEALVVVEGLRRDILSLREQLRRGVGNAGAVKRSLLT